MPDTLKAKLNTAFDAVQAEPSLKQQTLEALPNQRRRRAVQLRAFAAAAACFAVVLLGGFLYFTPTAEIAMDINPSICLGVNRFDRVITAEGLNADGTALLETVSVRHRDYRAALDTLMDSSTIQRLLSEDGLLSVGVICREGPQARRLLSGIEAETAATPNAECYCAGQGDAAAAAAMGLSTGKYRVYLAIAALDPTATPEAAASMTMRELRDWLAALEMSAESDALPSASPAPAATDCTETSCPQTGHGHGYGNGYGNGTGNGNGNGTGGGHGRGHGHGN